MRDIPFVDAHVHFWDLKRLHYGWLTPPFADDGPNGSVEAIASDFLPADYRAETAGWTIAGAVHVEAGADPAQAVAETEWLEGQADSTGLPSGIVAHAALDHPELDRLLAAHAAHPRVRGIRHIVNWHAEPKRTYTPRDVTQDEAWRRGYALLAKHGLSFDLQCYPGQMADLAPLVAGQETPVMINHAGMGVDGLAGWLEAMRPMAALPQVSVKVSGMGFVERSWSASTMRDYVLRAIDLFGTDRVMFASDFPTDRLFGTLEHTLGSYAEIIAGFSEDEKRAMWGRNADRLYRLGLGI